MTTRLYLYNEALRLCGERSTTLTEAREPRYLLDEVWNNGGVKHCLENGFWRFATRLLRIDYDTDVTPAFGYTYAFTKPTDWCRTSGICSDEYFRTPLLQYVEEAGYWYSDLQQIYVMYVSNGDSYGNDLTVWTQQFADYVATHFARKICFKLTKDKELLDMLTKEEDKAWKSAKSHDASGSPTQFPAPGSWVTSRSSRYGRSRDRGNNGSLIG